MVKKVRVEKWELYYMFLCVIMFGFWMGYILGGSSSWVARPEARELVIPNGAVIIVCFFVLFLLIKVVLYYYRKIELIHRKDEQFEKLK